jgi:preprotein translocase subunit SecD
MRNHIIALMQYLAFPAMCVLTVVSGVMQHKDPEKTARHTRHIQENDSAFLTTGWYYVTSPGKGLKRPLDRSRDTFYIDPNPIVTAKNVTSFEIFESQRGAQKYVGLAMRLDDPGTESWSAATSKSIGKKVAFVVNNRLLQVSKVYVRITAGLTALNRGNYSRDELEDFKRVIEGGR